ncbi:carboxypeptidase-like regulatory domain-containing protein [Granulicella sp. 5B5]|uniref:TonB-dependent receptor n=1 Tax=Granulicella sp. 5B5 TaxID=1617967 RepID=UPI0015F37357|nr:carboxypeptidase-like regulatory domain-containing protein [Granulicella sp. 5B5]
MSGHAQNSTAAVTGAVADSTGAKVPGAKVTLTNVETNVARATVSNNTGDYNFVGVPPAKYTLSVTAPSFQTQKIAAFDVAVDQTVNINAVLKTGDVNVSVTVEAVGAQIESTTSQLGTVIGTKEVNDLPLNGRNFTQLLELTPGATPISVGQNSSGSNTANNNGDAYIAPSLNGQTSRSTFYTLDGLNDTNNWYNTYAIPPIIDTILEFKVSAHDSAEYGGVTGGVVNLATKAGTNSLHGSLWEFIRNNAFDAIPWVPPTTPSIYRQNQFGVQVGGPVVVPHLYNGHDKTFFEIAYEGYRKTQNAASVLLIPTAAQMAESSWGSGINLPYADFSSATTGIAGCSSGATTVVTASCQLYDPTGNNNANSNRPGYVGNQIPASELDPRAVAYINALFPAPTTIPGYAFTAENEEVTTPTIYNTYNWMIRLDQHIGTKDFIFARYNNWQEKTTGSSFPHLFSYSQLPAQQYGVSWLHVFNPSLTMQVQYGRTHVSYNSYALFDNPAAYNAYMPDPSLAQNFIGGITLMPDLSVSGGQNGFGAGENSSPAANEANTHEWLGSISKTIGRHVIQAGGGWEEINYGETIRNDTSSFNGSATSDFTVTAGNTAVPQPGAGPGATTATVAKQTGVGLASFLLDEPTSATKRNVLLTERPGGIGNIYVQDTWHALPKLTLNMGIRYDRTVIPQYGTDASIGNQGSIETGDFDFNTGKYILQVAPPTCAVRGRAPCLPSATLPANVEVALNQKILHGSKLNIGPRFGLAYSVNNTLAIRGSFGIFFDNWAASIQLPQNFQGSWPDVGTLGVSSLNTPGSALYVTGQNPFAVGTSLAGLQPAASPFTSNVNYFVDPLVKNPYSEQWNLGIEQQMDRNTVFSLNYVGAETHRLDIGGYYNTGALSTTSFATRLAKDINQTTGVWSGANATGQPFPYMQPDKWDRPGGNATYNALQASLARTSSKGLTYHAAYTFSRSIDEGDDGFFGVEGGVTEDPYNVRGSRGPSGYNIPHLLTLAATYAVPVGKGKSFSTGNKIGDYILGNWEVSSIFILRSGQAFTITSSGDIGNTGNGGTYERANYNGASTVPLGGRNRFHWFNTSAFSTPLSGTLGNSGRNMLMDPTYYQEDVSVFRDFPIWESLRVSLRADAFNVLNHPVLGTPGAATTTPTNTAMTSGLGVITGTANSQRIMQFSGKIQF